MKSKKKVLPQEECDPAKELSKYADRQNGFMESIRERLYGARRIPQKSNWKNPFSN